MKFLRTTSLVILIIIALQEAPAQVLATNVSSSTAKTTTSSSGMNAMPAFIGGEHALRAYIQESLQYPENGVRKGLEGTVIVSYYINPDGSIEKITIKESAGEELDTAAIKIVKGMPNWKPAVNNGTPIRVKYLLPITFELTN